MASLVIGTAGHIDHGKSALVKALTGTDPDRLKEEQARGITIDLGFAHMTIGDLDVAFVDVPGHERFVRNMLAGAGGLDAVLLVVAADESVMPQTREHFEICRLLGLERGVIVLTKADLADAQTIELAELEVRELVAGSFLDGAPVVPVSSRTGAGLDQLRQTLAGLANGTPRGGRGRRDAARLPVDRVFSVKGFGTVVTGTLVTGRVAEGDELSVMPGGRAVRVRGLQVHGRSVTSADAPRRLAVNLGAIDVEHLSRGVTLATPDSLGTTRRADVRLELLADARPLRHGARVRVHHGTADVLARVVICAVQGQTESSWRQAVAGESGVAVPAGGRGFMRLRFEQPVAISRRDRLVIRAASPPMTIGGAVVLDPAPPPAGLRRAGALARFMSLDVSEGAPLTDASAIAVWLKEAGGAGVEMVTLAARSGQDATTVETGLAGLAGGVAAVGTRRFDAAVVKKIADDITRELAAHHSKDALDPGMPREALRDRVAAHAAPALFDAVLTRLTSEGTTGGTDRIHLTSHRSTTLPHENVACQRVEEALRAAGLAPPDVASLAAATGLPLREVERAEAVLAREGRVVKTGGLAFHAGALAKLKSEIVAMRNTAAGAPTRLDVGTIKQRYGVSRKFAIPLLEWLDRERVTRRVGDSRVVL